jgi:glycosyltransferase involved in cell wall biosynthesis
LKIFHFLGIGKVPKRPMFDPMGGTERVALEIAKRQVARGHDVTVASMSITEWSGIWEGVHILHLKPYRWPRIRYRGRIKEIGRHLRLAVCVWFGQYDVIHLHEYINARLFPRRTIVTHFHNDPLGGLNDEEFVKYAPRYWGLVSKSGAQIAVSNYVASRLRLIHKAAGPSARPERIVTNQSGVDLSLYSYQGLMESRTKIRRHLGLQSSDVLFLFAAAVVPAKGGDVLAKAFSRLSRKYSNSYLAIAGGSGLWVNPLLGAGAQTDDLEEVIRKILTVAIDQKRAFLLGLVSPVELPSIYAAADIFVLPTVIQEGFGLVLLEAFAAGRPIIATRSGGIPDLIRHGENGLLVNRGDVQDLYDAMRTLLKDEDLRIRLGEEGKRAASNFSWEDTVQRLESIYVDASRKQQNQ